MFIFFLFRFAFWVGLGLCTCKLNRTRRFPAHSPHTTRKQSVLKIKLRVRCWSMQTQFMPTFYLNSLVISLSNVIVFSLVLFLSFFHVECTAYFKVRFFSSNIKMWLHWRKKQEKGAQEGAYTRNGLYEYDDFHPFALVIEKLCSQNALVFMSSTAR